MSKTEYKPTKNEEIINVLTHFPGVLAGIYILFTLSNKTSYSQDPEMFWSIITYALSFIIVFSASSIYHITFNDKFKKIFKRLDHAAIFVFIGGCYTPFIINHMINDYKYWFLALIWILVFMGIGYKFFSKYKNPIISVSIYVSFGFLCFAVKNQFLDHIPSTIFTYLLTGGFLYVVGVFFYLLDRLPFNHGIWHIFVLGGAYTHYLAVYYSL